MLGPLTRRTHPLSRVVALVIWATPLLLSVDWVSAAVSVVCAVALAPFCGATWAALARRAWPLAVFAPISGVSMALYGRSGGHVYLDVLFAHVTDNSLHLAAAVMLRVFALGLPAMILLPGIDVTELGDGLAQILRLPERMVISACAGFRLVGLCRRDWEALQRSRRARGLGDGWLVKRWASQSYSLLVLALRRGSRLATAMEARGFGAYPTRTWARRARLGVGDLVLVVVSSAVVSGAIGCALWAGEWRLLGG